MSAKSGAKRKNDDKDVKTKNSRQKCEDVVAAESVVQAMAAAAEGAVNRFHDSKKAAARVVSQAAAAAAKNAVKKIQTAAAEVAAEERLDEAELKEYFSTTIEAAQAVAAAAAAAADAVVEKYSPPAAAAAGARAESIKRRLSRMRSKELDEDELEMFKYETIVLRNADRVFSSDDRIMYRISDTDNRAMTFSAVKSTEFLERIVLPKFGGQISFVTSADDDNEDSDKYVEHMLPPAEKFRVSVAMRLATNPILRNIQRDFDRFVSERKIEDQNGWTIYYGYHVALGYGWLEADTPISEFIKIVSGALLHNHASLDIIVRETKEYAPPAKCTDRPHDNGPHSSYADEDCPTCSARFLCGIYDDVDSDADS